MSRPVTRSVATGRYVRRLSSAFRSFGKEQVGGILVMFAAMLPVMVGLGGLGVEVGYWYVAKRGLQTEADASAIGGTWERAFGRASEIINSATNEAVRNGFPNSAETTIAVNSPPTDGGYAGNVKAVQVILTRDYRPMLASLFLAGEVTIAARATGIILSSGNACVLGLNGAASSTVGNTGNLTLSAPNCTLASNSTAGDGISFGGSSDVTVKSVWSAGGMYTGGSAVTHLTEPAQTNMWPLEDPYEDTPYTAPSGCTNNNLPNIADSRTLTAGTYCGGLHLLAGANVDLEPGTYWMKGGDLVVNGGATLRCSLCTPGGEGVTFVFTTPPNDNTAQIGTVTINGSATVTLNAPATGTYKGLLFFQDPRAPTSSGRTASLNGGSATVLNGAIYFPSNDVDYSGNISLASQCTLIVANKVNFTGNAGVNVDDCTNQGVPIVFTQKISLVE